jgi:YVTN family beta-propeller protein
VVTGRLLVVCKQAQTLEVIDLASGETAGSIRASAFTPHEVAATPDGRRAYLPIYSDAFLGDPGTDGRAIDVVDLVDLRPADGFALDFASRPHLPLMGTDGRLYVGTELDESVSVFDPSSGVRVARLPTGRPQSHMFVLSPDGSRAYSTNVDTGTVSVIDVASETLVDVIEVAGKIQRISISPDGSTVFTADQESPRLAAIDVGTRDISWIDLPSTGFGSAVTSDGTTLVVALRWTNQFGLIELAGRTLGAVVDVPAHPQAIVIHPEGRFAYSACAEADQVVEVDLHTGAVSRTFDTAQQPDGICWAADPQR